MNRLPLSVFLTAISLSALAAAPGQGQATFAGGGVSISCGGLVDANGAKVTPKAAGGQIGTSTSRPCAARAAEAPVMPAPRAPEPVALPGPVPLPAPSPEAIRPDSAEGHTPLRPVRAATERTRGVEAPLDLSAETTPSPARQPRLRFATDSPERVGAALLTGGAVLWILHSGLLTSLLMLGVPLWRHVDMLPIVAGAQPDESEAQQTQPGADEIAVVRMLGARDTSPGNASTPS